MARIQLQVDDPVNAMTLKSLLEADGQKLVTTDPEVVITDALDRAAETARSVPTLVLAKASQIREAVAVMREGVYGYIFVPLQPGEAELMAGRALATSPPPPKQTAIRKLEEVVNEHVLAVLRYCKGSRIEAARLLGIGRNTLWRKLKRIGKK